MASRCAWLGSVIGAWLGLVIGEGRWVFWARRQQMCVGMVICAHEHAGMLNLRGCPIPGGIVVPCDRDRPTHCRHSMTGHPLHWRAGWAARAHTCTDTRTHTLVVCMPACLHPHPHPRICTHATRVPDISLPPAPLLPQRRATTTTSEGLARGEIQKREFENGRIGWHGCLATSSQLRCGVCEIVACAWPRVRFTSVHGVAGRRGFRFSKAWDGELARPDHPVEKAGHGA